MPDRPSGSRRSRRSWRARTTAGSGRASGRAPAGGPRRRVRAGLRQRSRSARRGPISRPSRRARSSVMAPLKPSRSGSTPPTTLVPPPNGTTAMRPLEQSSRMLASSVSRAGVEDGVGGARGVARAHASGDPGSSCRAHARCARGGRCGRAPRRRMRSNGSGSSASSGTCTASSGTDGVCGSGPPSSCSSSAQRRYGREAARRFSRASHSSAYSLREYALEVAERFVDPAARGAADHEGAEPEAALELLADGDRDAASRSPRARGRSGPRPPRRHARTASPRPPGARRSGPAHASPYG